MDYENIDKTGVITSLQSDLETARLEIIRLRNKRFPIEPRQAASFVRDNYLICLLVVMSIYYIGSLIIQWREAAKHWR